MKKSLLILCAAALALVSCNKELTPSAQGTQEPMQVVFKLSATHPDETKTVKTAWETDDVVFVFFSEQTAPAYLEMKFDGSTWVNTSKSLSFTEGETGTMTAVYLPFGSDADVLADSGAYKFDKTYLSFYLTAQLPYTVSGGEVSGTFSMQIPEGYVQFFEYVPSSYLTTQVELREPHLTPQGIASIAADGTITNTTIAHGAPLPGYAYKKEGTDSDDWGFVFSGILAEGARNVETDYFFTMVYGGWDGSYYTHSFTGKKFYRGAKEGRALRLPDGGWNEITDYKPIDLGCDVDGKRVYWCSRNLGALVDIPETDTDDARQASWGDYFAWGETAPKTNFTWANYQLLQAGGSTWHEIEKYTYPDDQTFAIWYDKEFTFVGDNKTVLEPADDAAHAVLGGLWRMPTEAEWEALTNHYYNLENNGSPIPNFAWVRADWAKGYKVYSNFNQDYIQDGRYIFLPFAGRWDNNGDYDGLGLDGVAGHYWSSSLATRNEYPYGPDSASAFYTFFNSTSLTLNQWNRSTGYSVRAVMN